jgi:predicted acylesterase/phospholipase RssA
MCRRVSALVLSGGGQKGMSAVGAIEEFHRHFQVLDTIRVFAGTSIGAILCAAFCTGSTPLDLLELTNSNPFCHEYDILSFEKTFGVDTGSGLRGFIRHLLKDAATMTFEAVKRRYGKDLIVCATNLRTRSPVYFSASTSPNLVLETALYASCAIPVLFRAAIIDNQMYVDGCLTDNFPVSYMLQQYPEFSGEILGVGFVTHLPCTLLDTWTLEQYLVSLMECCCHRVHKSVWPKRHVTVLELAVDARTALEFKPPKGTWSVLYESGIRQARQYIKKNV